MWNAGCQMVALNYQTGDKSMQLNQAKFKENGNCGYLLKPEFMFRQDFNQYDKNTLYGVESLKICLKVIGARHLMRSGRGTASPSVEVEMIGADFDSGTKLTTKTIRKYILFLNSYFTRHDSFFINVYDFNKYNSCSG